MLGAQSLSAGRDLYRATLAVNGTSVVAVSSEGPPHSVAFYGTQDVEDLLTCMIFTKKVLKKLKTRFEDLKTMTHLVEILSYFIFSPKKS
jgi:hypothetical protein